MLKQFGLPWNALSRDLDRLYVELLLKQVRASSLRGVVILAQDEVYDDRGEKMNAGTFFVPNDYVLKLAREHPEFLPGVSIHPGRPDALAELDRCLAEGAVLMKCLPNCQNIDCSDPRYTRFWERMAEAGLPLLAHTGGEHTVQVLRPEFSHPRILQRPLECGVKVIAAHCGTKSGLFDPDFFRAFAEMTQRYANLYGDTSAFNVPIRGRHIRECLPEPLVSRMVHGSDFPVPVLGHWAWIKGLVGWKTFRDCQRARSLLERDYRLKLAMGFPPESFTRLGTLITRGNPPSEGKP